MAVPLPLKRYAACLFDDWDDVLSISASSLRPPFFGGGSCSFCLSVFKCSFQVGGVAFLTYLSWKAWLMLYIFGLSLLFFGSPPVTVTAAGTRSSNSTTSIQGLNVGTFPF